MIYTKMHGAGNSFVIIECLHGEEKGEDLSDLALHPVDKAMQQDLDQHGGIVKGGGYAPLHVPSMSKWELSGSFHFGASSCRHDVDSLKGEDLSDLALRLCSEKTGPGADGMIAVLPGGPEEDFSMLFYNADGSLGEMCGNGARCVARYGLEHCFSPDPERIRFRATAGLITARRIDRERYEVRLPDPSVIDLKRQAEGERCCYVELGDPGLPHAVVEVPEEAFDDLDALRERGRRLRHSGAFPKGANVSFVCLSGENRVRAITFERGVEDFTLACGTGCGSIAVSLTLLGRVTEAPVEIQMPGGELRVSLRREGERVTDLLLTGPTAVVETGEA